MKKLTEFLLLACCIACFGCSGSNSDNTSSSDNGDETTADTAVLSDSIAGDMTADASFALEAANGGMAEVELGKLAQEKATDAKVKEFASMMITDHSKANEELKAIAAAKQITLPTVPNPDKQTIKKELSAKSGDDFDKAYVAEMIKDHQKDISLFEQAQKTLQDPELKQFVEKTLPVLRKHMDHIGEIKK
ncbi:MAG TPA: DUF4142 domain-containing protein [Pseudosphingobacterium sp.]|nr:DUF4142 domain-containing protein [Pseudosphingobacterium sp.]